MLFGAVTISIPVLTIVTVFTTLYPKNVECIETEVEHKRVSHVAYSRPSKFAVLSRYLRKKAKRERN